MKAVFHQTAPKEGCYKRIPFRDAERGCEAEDGQLDMVQVRGQDAQGGKSDFYIPAEYINNVKKWV